MKEQPKSRESGYYWVKDYNGWIVGFWTEEGKWRFNGQLYAATDTRWDEIDERKISRLTGEPPKPERLCGIENWSEKLSGEAKTPDQPQDAEITSVIFQTLKHYVPDCWIVAAGITSTLKEKFKIQELTGGSVPTPSDEERLMELSNAFYAGREGVDATFASFKHFSFGEWLISSKS